MSEPDNNYVGLCNSVGQLEGFNSNQMATNLQTQPYARAHATHFPLHYNVNMPTNLQAQPYVQDFHSHDTSLPLHNVDMNIMNDGNTENRVRSYPSVSYYGPVDTFMNGQLNTSSRKTHENSSSPVPGSFQALCGPSIPYSDTTNGDCPTDNHYQYFGK